MLSEMVLDDRQKLNFMNVVCQKGEDWWRLEILNTIKTKTENVNTNPNTFESQNANGTISMSMSMNIEHEHEMG